MDCKEPRRETEEEDWKTLSSCIDAVKSAQQHASKARSVAKAALTDLKQTEEVLEHERSQFSNEVAKSVEEVKVSTLSLTICLLLFCFGLSVSQSHFLSNQSLQPPS